MADIGEWTLPLPRIVLCKPCSILAAAAHRAVGNIYPQSYAENFAGDYRRAYMNADNAERILCRWICERRPGQKIPPLVRHAYAWVDRKTKAKGPNCPRELYDIALRARDEIMQKSAGYQRRAQVREQVAEYLERKIFPHSHDFKFLAMAEKLRNARRTGTWGLRPNGDLVTIWDDKSGLLRLDPDEAREDAQRLSERYVPALVAKAKDGAGVHYCVFTLPNVDAGKLAAGQRKIFRRYSNLLRKRLAKKKLFPEILGSIAVIEAPLAADGSWNVHLNVVLLTRSKFEAGLYKRLRAAWYWNVHIEPVKTDVGGLARTFNELIKYPTAAIAEKSGTKTAAGRPRAPAMIDWSAERFIEWHDAQLGFRRTRTYGGLYGSKVPKPQPTTIDDVDWYGALSCAPDRFYAQIPLIDLIPGHKFATGTTQRQPTGPP